MCQIPGQAGYDGIDAANNSLAEDAGNAEVLLNGEISNVFDTS